MKREELKKLLNIIFRRDYLEKSKKKESYFEDIFFEESEIFLMVLKSIVLKEDKIGGVIDYNRLLKEISIWKYYRHTNNETLIRISNENYAKHRLENFEELGIASMAILIANENIETSLSEILKMSFFFTENIRLVLKNYYESAIIFNLINGNSIEKTILEGKKRIIELSLKNEIEKNNELIRESDKKKYILEFEKERVKIIMDISNIDEKNFKVQKLKIGNIIEKFLSGEDYSDTVMSMGLYEYIFKLRKGRISINSFRNSEIENIDYFSLEKNRIIRDRVFGKMKILEVIHQDKYELRYIETKVGNFRLFRKK